MRPANFLITFGSKFGDDEIALLIEKEKSRAIFHDESVCPADLIPDVVA